MWLNFQIVNYKHVAEIKVFSFFNTVLLSFSIYLLILPYIRNMYLDYILVSESLILLWAGSHSLDDFLCILNFV